MRNEGSTVEIRWRSRTMEQFTSHIRPDDAPSCIALLYHRAAQLRLRAEEIELWIYPGRQVGRRFEYKV